MNYIEGFDRTQAVLFPKFKNLIVSIRRSAPIFFIIKNFIFSNYWEEAD